MERGRRRATWKGGSAEKDTGVCGLRPLCQEISASDPADWECNNDTTINLLATACERSNAAPPTLLTKYFGVRTPQKKCMRREPRRLHFQLSVASTHEEREFTLKFSAIEIYNEAVRDLLSMDNSPLRVLDDPERGTIVEKLTEVLLRDCNHLKELLAVCAAQRQIGETLLNEMSSRSHQILRLTIESSAREFLGKGSSSTLAASVNFVDLAGSERASQALSVGNRLKEGCHINRSLLSLGTVIRKLSKGRNGHIPYRDSKLTRILQPSLGGNARTAIICTMSPARSHIEQSRNTLLFASCAKEVETSARVNVVMSDKALVKHLQKELARLEGELKYPRSSSTTSQLEALLREKDARIKQMEKEIKELRQQRDLAESRVEDLLRVVGSGRPSTQQEESSQISTSDLYERSEVVNPTSGSSIPYPKIASYGRHAKIQNQNQELSIGSLWDSFSSRMLIESIPHRAEDETAQESNEDSEDVCKEVRCIEVDGPGRCGDSESLLAEENANARSMILDSGDNERNPIKLRIPNEIIGK
ncbi:uncharacterized protein A4U43_C03F23070 [Asparagus officinalis]|uniref:Kinesin-like protein n=1 Tax=Asparagus officinalis TaxID=4686 RepID=A0A5P1FF59_ASPOF|nr:uncharacterized protein A4U43_C03F23070 [Asparagus officinalis]